MNNTTIRRNILGLARVIAIVLVFVLPQTIYAVTGVPDVDINAKPTNTAPSAPPEGAFKLMICDGPAKLNHYNPTTKEIDLSTNPDGTYIYGAKEGYIPCDFTGLMKQAQFLINTMVVLGVIAALIGLAYAGSLYVTGAQDKIKKAKEIFPKIAWGFIIMLTAWFIVYQILQWLTGSSSYLTGII